jgi:hypothetical protein
MVQPWLKLLERDALPVTRPEVSSRAYTSAESRKTWGIWPKCRETDKNNGALFWEPDRTKYCR